jgi:hypothetical protein
MLSLWFTVAITVLLIVGLVVAIMTVAYYKRDDLQNAEWLERAS